ncbi:SSI family serine proteinase inhibitor [Nonomuraea candida]|uniref:SSI family serine proteinase inhibitor n=1 Tax=Nonomuraea candida TaxID=359159 RepID=UPI0005BCEC8B|nr:SSI family serine proteinase inhibitor [Nonomuraea candida]
MPFAHTVARRLAVLGLGAAATLAAPFASLPAVAAASAQLTITVTPEAGGAYAVRLFCDPDGGLHPRPELACDAVRSVNGYIEDLNYDPGPCQLILAPVDVTVEGHWYGMPVSYLRQFPNECVMKRTLGPVV